MKSAVLLIAFFLIIGHVKANKFQLERIVNGETAFIKPYYVRVAAIGKEREHFGAGTLVTRRHVLTVGSLVKGFRSWSIEYGSHFLKDLIIVKSQFGFVHPLCEEGSNSLGIIILSHHLNDEILEPIELADVVEPLPRLFEEGTIVGFDYDHVDISKVKLKSAYLSMQPEVNCRLELKEHEFCAANYFYDANVCTLDVGSAFALHYRGRIVLGGLLSETSERCLIGDPSKYVHVQSYNEWIKVVSEA